MSSPSTAPSPAAPSSPALRIWPAILLLAILGIAKAAPLLVQELSMPVFMFAAFAPLAVGAGILVWWAFGSRAPGRERWLGPLAVIAIATATYFLLDPSLQETGALFLAVPTGVAALALALLLFSRASSPVRVSAAIAGAIVGFAGWEVARSDGLWGDFNPGLHWRWEPTAEDRFLADLKANDDTDSAAQASSAEETAVEPVWGEFRGPQRDNSVRGIVIDTDWQAHPVKEIWRRRVGPGWSSFAVAGHSIFTQEQRGDSEVIACYDADTGAERWTYKSPARFWESMAGAGPRATPTLHNGRLYAVGATGLVHCLNPATGADFWQRDLSKDAGRQPPMWGFSSSPLVVDDLVIVYAGGADDKGVFAYSTENGEPQWKAPAGDHSYSSPHRASISGRDVVLMLTNTGLSAIEVATGKTVWTYDWNYNGYRVIQPLVVDDSSILLGTGIGTGTRRVDVTFSDAAPDVKDRWTSLDMKPDFNDFVAHKGALYGFDHNIFACIDLETGKRNWKKGRYGNGQVLLLPDADQLLVLTETGDVVIVRTNPKELEELARKKVLTDKTWNHPVLAGNRLYVRNAEEAVCLELPIIEPAAVAANREER